MQFADLLAEFDKVHGLPSQEDTDTAKMFLMEALDSLAGRFGVRNWPFRRADYLLCWKQFEVPLETELNDDEKAAIFQFWDYLSLVK